MGCVLCSCVVVRGETRLAFNALLASKDHIHQLPSVTSEAITRTETGTGGSKALRRYSRRRTRKDERAPAERRSGNGTTRGRAARRGRAGLAASAHGGAAITTRRGPRHSGHRCAWAVGRRWMLRSHSRQSAWTHRMPPSTHRPGDARESGSGEGRPSVKSARQTAHWLARSPGVRAGGRSVEASASTHGGGMAPPTAPHRP